jgi:hypothetical protein
MDTGGSGAGSGTSNPGESQWFGDPGESGSKYPGESVSTDPNSDMSTESRLESAMCPTSQEDFTFMTSTVTIENRAEGIVDVTKVLGTCIGLPQLSSGLLNFNIERTETQDSSPTPPAGTPRLVTSSRLLLQGDEYDEPRVVEITREAACPVACPWAPSCPPDATQSSASWPPSCSPVELNLIPTYPTFNADPPVTEVQRAPNPWWPLDAEFCRFQQEVWRNRRT